MLVADYQYLTGGDTLYATQQTLSRLGPGESVSFFPLNTFGYPALASGVVAEVARVTDPALLPLLGSTHAAASRRAVATPCSACRAGLNSFAAAQLYNLTFAAALPPAATTLTLLNADNISNTGAVVDGCSFGGSNSNLGRFKSSGGRLTGNRWLRGPTHQNLEIEPLQNWMEGMLGIHDIRIAGNTFYGTAASPVHLFGAAMVTQQNNTFVP